MSMSDINNAFSALMDEEHSLEQNTINQQVTQKAQQEEIDVEELERQIFGAGQYKRVLNWADEDEEEDEDDPHPALIQQKFNSNDSFDACNNDLFNASNDSENNKNQSSSPRISPGSQTISQSIPTPINEKSNISGVENRMGSRQISVGSGFSENVVVQQDEEDEEGWTQVKSKSSKNKKKNGSVNSGQSKLGSQTDKRRTGRYSNGSRQNNYSQRSYK